MNLETVKKSLDQWYSEDAKRMEIYQSVTSGKAGFSLRTIDWFVTNYAARKPIVFLLPEAGRVVNVHEDYRGELKCFHKSAFDSFKRKGPSKSTEEAELRQKNFFKWAIQNGIIDYVSKNATDIERDMVAMRKRCRESIEAELSGGGSSKQTQRPRKRSRVRTDHDDVVIPPLSFPIIKKEIV